VCTSFNQVFNRSPYRDKKVVGVFVRFLCAASYIMLFCLLRRTGLTSTLA
jgi:predicted ABC-type exoprotein transport system permease subunit